MNGVLFLAQGQLDGWLDEGVVDMGNETLIFPDEGAEFPMAAAVRFVSVVDGSDQNKLLGKVKSIDALRMGGAEVSVGAVVLGEAAYEVEEGFMLTVPAHAPKVTVPSMAAKPASKASGREADLLAQFILDKLS